MNVDENVFNLKKSSAFKPLADLVSGVMHGEYVLKESRVTNHKFSDTENLTHYEFDVVRKIPHK